MADAIVLAGTAAVEKRPGTPATKLKCRSAAAAATRLEEWTDEESFEVMEPAADGFRNYLKTKHSVRTEELLLDRAQLLGLSAPEMTVLLGGLRVLGANHEDRPARRVHDRKGS